MPKSIEQTKEDAMIKNCTCKHDYQDEKYGKGRRVFNQLAKATGAQEYRCTVCEKKA